MTVFNSGYHTAGKYEAMLRDDIIFGGQGVLADNFEYILFQQEELL